MCLLRPAQLSVQPAFSGLVCAHTADAFSGLSLLPCTQPVMTQKLQSLKNCTRVFGLLHACVFMGQHTQRCRHATALSLSRDHMRLEAGSA